MAFVPFPEGIQVATRYLLDGQQAQNVFHLRHANVHDFAGLSSIGTRFFNWWDTHLKALQSNNTTLNTILVRSLESPSAPAIEWALSLPASGTRANAAMPNNVTMAFKWTTELSGRSYKGRTYHIGATHDYVLDAAPNRFNDAVVAALLASYGQLIAEFDNDLDGLLCVASRINAGAERSQGVLTPINFVSSDGVVDSQRRRLPGRGS